MVDNELTIDPQDILNAVVEQRDAALNAVVELRAKCAKLERLLLEAQSASTDDVNAGD